MPSCNNRNRSFSVETITSSVGANSLLVKTLGNRSLAARSASIHADLSSLDTQRKWRVFVPVNMESLLSSDLLARTEETCKAEIKKFQQPLKQRKLCKIEVTSTHLVYKITQKKRWEKMKSSCAMRISQLFTSNCSCNNCISSMSGDIIMNCILGESTTRLRVLSLGTMTTYSNENNTNEFGSINMSWSLGGPWVWQQHNQPNLNRSHLLWNCLGLR